MELIKSNSRFYYDGELRPGILLKDSGENEIKVSKFNAVKIGDRHFLLDPNVSAETFLNLQIRNGRHEYLYKSGDKIIVRDEDGNEIMPVEWIEKGMKVITAEGTGTVETFTDNIALIKSQDGLKNHYIKNLSFADTTSDFQKYRQGWQIYEKILPQIQQEIKLDNTRLLKGAFMDAFNKLDASMPKKNAPAAEPTNIETPKIEPVKVAKEDATPKVSLVSKIKNAFKKPQNVPEVATPPPTVNANHDLATPPPPQTTLKSSKPEHLGKEYTHVDESNRAGQDNHVLAHISLNPDSTNDKDKYLYHYEVGAHRDPITVNKFLNSSGDSKDEHGADITPPAFITNGVYIPGEEVLNKTNGERNTVVSHIDFNKDTGSLNPNNILVKDASGQIKSIPRGDVKLSSHDRTTHSIVNTDNGNKHLHDLQEGDVINHEGNKHSVLYSDPKKGLATVNQATGQMHFVSANNYHKPYLGEVKPEVKEGQQVQIGKKRFKVEHVSGEEEKGTTILSHTNKLGEKEYYEHPTNKLFDKILKPADLQEYQGDRFSPKAKPKTEESDPQKYPHADMHDIDSAQEIMELKSKHPNLTEDDIDFLKTGRGLNLKDINGMSQDEVHTILSKQPGYKAPVPDSNPMPETPLPQPVQEQKQKSRLDQITELHDNAFGEHNKTVGKDSVTHRVGIGDLAVKAGAGGTEILNKEVPIGKKKTAIIHDIDPVGKKITFRMKKDDPEDKSKYKTRSIDNFKTYVQENEELDPRADTDVRSRQVAHENDFQNKVYERVAKHLHEKGLEPSKENIDNELNTSNTGLRQSLEQYHKTYEANHNKEKAKGSIVDHPDYEKLDMDKTLARVPDIENKVAEAMGNIKDHRADQREALKFGVARDIATDFYKQGKEYNDDPDPKYEADFEKHEKLGGKDEELHDSVREILADIKSRKEYEGKVEQGRQALKEGQQKARLANEEREKMSDKEYLENIYNKKDDIKKSSLNEQAGVQQDKGKLAFNNNPNYHNTEFEYHIVPRDKVTTSHTPIQGADSKVPFTPNAEHPASGQGREGYHSENIKGETDRKKVKDIADNPEFDQLINTSRSASDQAPPLIDARGHAINNGRFMAMDITSDENKKGYSEHLKSQLPSLFPNATPEQHEQMKAGIDKMTAEGNTPMLTRVPMNKADGEAYDLGKHGEDYGKFASATNDPNTKALGESEQIKAVQNSLTDEDKNKLFNFIPEGRTIGNHIKDVKKADEILDHLQGKGIISDTERSTLYGDDRRLNDKGKKYLSDIYKNAYFDKEGADLLDKNKMIGQKVSDFHSRNSDELNEIKTHSKAYDLQHDIKDAFKSMVADKDQSAGQQKVAEDSNVVKGLRYLMEYAGKGKDSEGVEYDDGKDALKKYIESVRTLKEGGGMFEIPEDEKDPKDFKEKYFDKYAKLFDQQKRIEANKQSPGKKAPASKRVKKPDIHPAGELIKELQDKPKDVSSQNENPDNAIENKEDNVSSEKSVDKPTKDEIGKSFEGDLHKSLLDEPSNSSPHPMRLESENVIPKLANTATGQQHLATLKNNGVPEEEIHTTGLHNLLNTDQKIPKTDIQDHLRHNTGTWKKENVQAPEHEQYSLPGSHTNYREVLHTYESPDAKMRKHHIREYNDIVDRHSNPSQDDLERYLTPEEKAKHKVVFEPTGDSVREQWEKPLQEARNIARSRMSKSVEDYAKMHNIKPEIRHGSDGTTFYAPARKEEPWDEGHYHPQGDANIIYHQRFNNRVTPEGKKVTHMEEQQSDIHQAGREKGYKDKEYQKKREELYNSLDEHNKKFGNHPDNLLLDELSSKKELNEEEKNQVKKLAQKYNYVNPETKEFRVKFGLQPEDIENLYAAIADKLDPHYIEKEKEFNKNQQAVPDVPLKGNKWKEHGFKQALMEAVKDNSDYLSWTTGDQQFKRWGSINVNWKPKEKKETLDESDIEKLSRQVQYEPPSYVAQYLKSILSGLRTDNKPTSVENIHKALDESNASGQNNDSTEFKNKLHQAIDNHTKGGWNVNIKGRHNDSDLSKDYHVNSLEDVKKLPGEAGAKWSDKIWDRIQKQPEGADYEPLRHGMNKEYSEVLPNIAKKHLKKFGIHPEDIELGEYNTHEKLDKILQDHESDIAAQNDYPKYAEVVEKMHSALSSGKSIKEASDELSKQTDSDQEQDIIDDIMVKLTEHKHSLQSHKYVGKEHSATEIKNLFKEIKASDRYSRYVQTTLSNKIQQLLTDTLMPPNDDDRSHPFATAVNHALGQAEGDPDIYRLEEIVKMLHPDNQIKPFKKPATKVHAVKITPELREHIIKNGFSMYKSFDEFEEPLQKSNINYPERIHAMRNRRGENISSIAVMNGDKILMGRRRDSDKWTLPGGHAEEGESAEETGIRELEEETGIKAKKLESLGSEEVKNPNAPELMINCFKYETDESTSMRDDPDTEVKKWVWVSTPISQDILDNLHAKKNVTLKLLGLQNWEKSFVYQMKTAFNNLIKLLS